MEIMEKAFLGFLCLLPFLSASRGEFTYRLLYDKSTVESPELLLGQKADLKFYFIPIKTDLKPINVDVSFVTDHPGIVLPVSNLTVKVPANFTVAVRASSDSAGFTTLIANTSDNHIDASKAAVLITVMHLAWLNILSQIIGWIYFVSWSISFYPQIYDNWKRKSVVGLNFDFIFLNIVGFSLYSVFNIGLYFVETIQDEYFESHPAGVNPVKLNDIIFSVHAVFACAVTIVQCFIYERGGQTISRTCVILLCAFAIILIISAIVAGAASALSVLDFLYICSYIKLFITLIKYVPQALLNYRRKSTSGWSIGNVLLDFTGGTFSIGQMLVDAYNFDDWSSIFGDPTKFGLGLFSIFFDVLFMLQHYVFYRNNAPYIDTGAALVAPEEVEETEQDEEAPR